MFFSFSKLVRLLCSSSPTRPSRLNSCSSSPRQPDISNMIIINQLINGHIYPRAHSLSPSPYVYSPVSDGCFRTFLSSPPSVSGYYPGLTTHTETHHVSPAAWCAFMSWRRGVLIRDECLLHRLSVLHKQTLRRLIWRLLRSRPDMFLQQLFAFRRRGNTRRWLRRKSEDVHFFILKALTWLWLQQQQLWGMSSCYTHTPGWGRNVVAAWLGSISRPLALINVFPSH